MNDLAPVIIMFTLIVTAGVTFYFFLKARHAERMAMIEKGSAPSLDWKPAPSNNFFGVKIGMLFVGIGFGILLAFIISQFTVDEPALYPGLMLLFGGGSLVLSYFLELRLSQKDSH